MIYLDSSALKSWGCREFYRLQFVKNYASVKPSIHYEIGKAVHAAIEEFWKGEPFEKAMDTAYAITHLFPVSLLNPAEVETFKRNVESLPDLISVYYDSVSYDPELLLESEKEWAFPLNDKVTICGRRDRVMRGPKLVDVKTASEIARAGTPWKKAYREEKLLDPQFGVYDWALQQAGTPAIECYLEVIVKPYKGKKARLEIMQLPEIISEGYRRRFKQQLEWICSEIAFYHEKYSEQRPWPMNSNMCVTKFSACPMIDVCTWGEIPKVMERLTEREEHLEVRKKKELTSDH